jgi:hypothetical protein
VLLEISSVNAEETSVYSLEDRKIAVKPTLCQAMDNRTNELVQLFQAAQSTSTHLVECSFEWEAYHIWILAEVTLPIEPSLEVRLVRHAVRIAASPTLDS